ncbi:Retinal guanylyl cyclase 2 [Platysternon megacephalum]|uniref:Retinal guanylyl cyclase 2 n=1 Tax=Platysternon megacephalum TaxID=55544 RepID=A0A4D9DM22_9SAUR|nr:Retinal guanylyl cyclase 2 [Platysternon megacephalum]
MAGWYGLWDLRAGKTVAIVSIMATSGGHIAGRSGIWLLLFTNMAAVVNSTSTVHNMAAVVNSTSTVHNMAADVNSTSTVHNMAAVVNSTSTVHNMAADVNSTSTVHNMAAVVNSTSTVHNVATVVNSTSTVHNVATVVNSTSTVHNVATVVNSTSTVHNVAAVVNSTSTVHNVAAVVNSTSTVHNVAAVVNSTSTVHNVAAVVNIMPPAWFGFHRFLLRLSNHPRWGRWWPQAPLLWLLLLGWPAWVQPATFKVGVMGPWTCDPIFAQALPEVAAQLAVGRLNRDPTLNQGYWFDYVLVNEECQTSQALVALVNAEHYASGFVGPVNPGACGAAGPLGRAWNKPVFSWACLNGDAEVERWGTFARPLPRASSVLYALLKFFRWAHVAVVTSRQELWAEVGQGLASSLREFGLPVGVVTTMEPGADGARNALRKVQRADNIRVVVMCMHSVLLGGEEQRLLLEKAEDLRMTDGTFVFIPYDALTYSLPYRRTPYPVLGNNTKLRLAYDAVLTVTIDAPERGFREAFQDAQQAHELPAHLDPTQVHPLFGTIYNSIYYLAKAVESTRQAGRWVMGSSIAEHARDFQLDGFCQPLAADEDGEPMVSYIILDTDGKGNRLWPTYSVATGPEGLRYVGHAIHWPHSASPSTDSSCWFDPTSVCSGGVDPSFILLLFILVSSLIVGGTILAYYIRRRILHAQLMKGPNKIILTMDDLTFIHTQSSSKKMDDSRASLAGKSVSDMRSFKSLAAAPDNTNVAVAELKIQVHYGTSAEPGISLHLLLQSEVHYGTLANLGSAVHLQPRTPGASWDFSQPGNSCSFL